MSNSGRFPKNPPPEGEGTIYLGRRKTPVMTREELDTVPVRNRYYQCQSCNVQGTDESKFKLLVLTITAFVYCKWCIEQWGARDV